MKQSPMPRRRTSLRPGGPLKRKKGIARRSAGLRARAVKPGLRAVIKAARETVYARSGGRCEACGDRQARECHHRKNRSQGGDWSPVNLLHVCRPCHRWIGRERPAARARGWAVWREDDPVEVPVWRRQDAWVLLAADGRLVPVLNHSGGPEQCESELERPDGGGWRCALGEMHEGDHECSSASWPQTDEEKAAWRISV